MLGSRTKPEMVKLASPSYGTMVHGPWSTDHGPWTMVHGPGTMVRRPSAPFLFERSVSNTERGVFFRRVEDNISRLPWGEGGAGTAKVRRKFTTDNITGTYRGGGRGRGEAFPILEFALIKKHSLSLRAVSMLVITWL